MCLPCARVLRATLCVPGHTPAPMVLSRCTFSLTRARSCLCLPPGTGEGDLGWTPEFPGQGLEDSADPRRAAFVRVAADSLQAGWPRGLPRALRVPASGLVARSVRRAQGAGSTPGRRGLGAGTTSQNPRAPAAARRPRGPQRATSGSRAARSILRGPLTAQRGASDAPSGPFHILLTVLFWGCGGGTWSESGHGFVFNVFGDFIYTCILNVPVNSK